MIGARTCSNAPARKFIAAFGSMSLLAVSVTAAAGLVTGTASAAVPPPPYTVNIHNREDVRQFYNVVHEGAAAAPDGWTGGSIAGMQPGNPVAGVSGCDAGADELLPGHGGRAAGDVHASTEH
jgi:hypothetical protein